MANQRPPRLVLADDDEDDRLLFGDALREICPETSLVMVPDGEELMSILLQPNAELPDAIFLDVNMPKKNGFECLGEIRSNPDLKSLPIIIFSTTAQDHSVGRAFSGGANFYVQKPGTFMGLKTIIKKIITMDWMTQATQTQVDNFLLNA